MNESELSDEEMQLVQKHREEKAQVIAARLFKSKAIATAHAFDRWSEETDQGLTFSTFIDTFGYQEGDGKQMYDAVVRINDAAQLPKR